MFENDLNDLFAAFFAIAAPIEEALLNVVLREVSQLNAAASRFGNEYFYAAAVENFPISMEFCGSEEYLVIYRAQKSRLIFTLINDDLHSMRLPFETT